MHENVHHLIQGRPLTLIMRCAHNGDFKSDQCQLNDGEH
jgi:hypothetical protein